ncbi:MAG: ATP-binding cassette domain-containing protein [Treponema sp.]|nr:ATP-binding cassette domain-containing protein [Treponema sp.]
MAILAAEQVCYTYPNCTIPAVRDVSLRFERGSYTAITGLNGSGKSTFARILCGLLTADSGTIVREHGASVRMVFQSPKEQIVCGTVARDTAFGPQNSGLPPGEVELRSIESLSVTGMLPLAERRTLLLSLGQTQKTAISGIIVLEPDVLIFDEAVALLDAASRADIFQFLAHWHSTGHTIIHITHDRDAIRHAETVAVFVNGVVKFTGPTDVFFSRDDLMKLVLGSPLPARYRPEKPAQQPAVGSEMALVVDAVSFAYDTHEVLADVSFALAAGTLTALTGISGSGKSTVLELCAGLLVPNSGSICARGRPAIALQNSDDALFEQFAADDVAFGPRNHGVTGAALVARVKAAMENVRLPFSEFGERRTFTLSGGEKRRLSVAGIIALGAPVLLFDEPTAGLDGPARYEIMQLFRRLTEQGVTVLFSTHHQDEADFSDRVISLARGTITCDSQATLWTGDETPATVTRQEPLAGTTLLKTVRAAAAYGSDAVMHRRSVVGRLPAIAKHLVFTALFVAGLAVRPTWLCAVAVGVSVLYALLARYPFGKLVKSMILIMPFLLLFCVFQMIFASPVPGEPVILPWKYFFVTPSKVWLCVRTLLHTESALVAILVFIRTTSEYELIDGLSILLSPLTLMHVPVKYALVIIEMIFRFIPLLIDEAAAIIKTQLVRGGLGKTKNGFARVRIMLPLFIPLIIQTIRRSEAFADALTERGFS